MYTNIVVKRKLWGVPRGAVAEPRRLAVRVYHAKVTDARSTIKINQHNLGLHGTVDDVLRVQILKSRPRSYCAHPPQSSWRPLTYITMGEGEINISSFKLDQGRQGADVG
jgi:hypothetical protein